MKFPSLFIYFCCDLQSSHGQEPSIVTECHTDCVARNGAYDNLYGTIIRWTEGKVGVGLLNNCLETFHLLRLLRRRLYLTLGHVTNCELSFLHDTAIFANLSVFSGGKLTDIAAWHSCAAFCSSHVLIWWHANVTTRLLH